MFPHKYFYLIASCPGIVRQLPETESASLLKYLGKIRFEASHPEMPGMKLRWGHEANPPIFFNAKNEYFSSIYRCLQMRLPKVFGGTIRRRELGRTLWPHSRSEREPSLTIDPVRIFQGWRSWRGTRFYRYVHWFLARQSTLLRARRS